MVAANKSVDNFACNMAPPRSSILHERVPDAEVLTDMATAQPIEIGLR
jgi:hypothetical protein